MTDYRKLYNKAKSELAKRHNAELKQIMVELGYKKAEKKEKKAEAKVEKKEEKK